MKNMKLDFIKYISKVNKNIIIFKHKSNRIYNKKVVYI